MPRTRASIRALFLPVLCAIAACDAGGFEDDVIRSGEGDVRGVVFGLVGGARRPVSGAKVFLLSASGDRFTTSTAADGGFELRDVPAGAARLVINDGGRRGILRELDVYASGDNDAGELFVQPLEQVAALVDIPGIGFEERVTRTPANAEFPVARGDGSVVYLHRRVEIEGGSPRYQVREVRVPSGEEVITWQGGYTPGPSELLHDRFLAYSGCVVDTRAAPAAVECTLEYEPMQRFAWRDAVYAVAKTWSYSGHLTYHADLIDFFVRRGPATGLGRYDEFFRPLYSFSEGSLTAMVPAGDGTSSMAHWDLETGLASTPIPVEHKWFPYYAVVGDGPDRAYYLADDEIGEVDFRAGSSRVLYRNRINEIRGAGPSRLIVTGILWYPGTSLWLMKTDVPYEPVVGGFAKVFTMLPRDPEMTIGGRAVSLCAGGQSHDCSATYLDRGLIRIVTHNPIGDNHVVDVDLDGDVVRKRVLDLRDPGTAIIERADGRQEAIARRDAPTGFIQLWVADLDGGDEPRYRQVTFLPSDHGTPFYSPDGDWLYSFVRDPLSGYVQLFRVRVRDRG